MHNHSVNNCGLKVRYTNTEIVMKEISFGLQTSRTSEVRSTFEVDRLEIAG